VNTVGDDPAAEDNCDDSSADIDEQDVMNHLILAHLQSDDSS